MPLFMGPHRYEGEMPSDQEIADAHRAGLEAQGEHGVSYLKYWVSREAKIVHCLVDAPDADTASRVHVQTTGSPPDEIYAVDERT